MGKCATNKTKVRGFAEGGTPGRIDAFDAHGNNLALTNTMKANPGAFGARAPGEAGVNPYEAGAGTTTGIGGGVHFSASDASNVTPLAPVGQASAGVASPGNLSRRDSGPLGKLDQDIAMGSAMGALSNTERYQLANPDNQPYSIGAPRGRGRPDVSAGAAPGSSAAASESARRTDIMSSLRDKLAEQPLYAGFADGGVIGTIKKRNAELAAVMEADAPAPKAAPVAEKPAPTGEAGDYAAQAAAIEAEQLAAARAAAAPNPKKGLPSKLGFVNGGKIQGPGTPTSDSIPAKVKETGEPIAVSTGERIVSKAQDALLQKIAVGMGYDSLDALLEQGTGKPVGPTIKGGRAHAATGAVVTSAQADRDIRANQIAALEAKSAPWLRPVANALGGAIDAVVDGPAQKPAVAPVATGGDQGRGVPVGHNPPPVARPDYQAPLGNTPRDVLPQTIAEPRFTANDRQVALPSGAVQGRSSVDATQLQAPDGGGYITNAKGKAMYLAPQAAPAKAAGAPTDAYGNDMSRTNQMKAELATMQHDRMVRDTGADITSPGTRAAAQQQLAQLGKDQALALLAGKDQRDAETAGLDRELKGQQIAQITANEALRKRVLEGDPQAVEQWNYFNRKETPDQYISVPDGEEVDPSGNVLRRPNQVVNVRTGEPKPKAPTAAVSVAVGTPVKAPDGTHTFQGKTITVKDGKVTGVK